MTQSNLNLNLSQLRSNPVAQKNRNSELNSNTSACANNSMYQQTNSTKSSYDDGTGDQSKRTRTFGNDFHSELVHAHTEMYNMRQNAQDRRYHVQHDSDSSGESQDPSFNALARRSSQLSSYNGLSIQSDMQSVVDSTASVYAPSEINEPWISDNASKEEIAMHDFLNAAGIF